MDDLLIRRMTAADLATVEEICDLAFHEVDLRTLPRDWPDPQRRPPARSQAWIERTARFLVSDADGCWVAEYDAEVVGFATSIVRERLWVLTTFAVRPGLQGKGAGRQLLDRALAYGEGCERWMLAASADARAVRRYWQAGFALHPQLVLHGHVDRAALPGTTGVREGDRGDRAWMDDLDRALRGAGHGDDHGTMAAAGRLLVTADRTGYAYATRQTVLALAARDTGAAERLLGACLAAMDGRVEIGHVTAANRWAVDVGMAAGLSLATRGYLGVRGMEPPAPYIHHGALL